MSFRGAELAIHRGAADAQGAGGFGNVAARVLYGLANEGGFGCAQRCRAAGYSRRASRAPANGLGAGIGPQRGVIMRAGQIE